MIRRVSRWLAFLLHPLLMPAYAVATIFNLNSFLAYSVNPALQRIVLLIVFTTTFMFPLLSSLFLLNKGVISSLEMETPEERRAPFFIALLCYITCFVLLFKLPVSRLFGMLILAAAMTILIALLLSFRYKVSIHMIGAGGFTGMLFALSSLLHIDLSILISLCIIGCGILGTSRLVLGAHTPSQIYFGFLIGFLTEWIFVTAMV